jgi:hypothetical protein
MIKEQKPQIMHVGIEEPREKRKEVLNCAIDTLEILKRYERFKKLRKEKDYAKNELKTIVKDIKTLFKEIQELMPHVEFPKEHKVEQEKPIVVVPRPQPKIEHVVMKRPEIKKDTVREKIERDIQDLRDKVARL